MFQKLLVPLDGTPYAAAALPLARGLAHEIGAEIVLVRVVPTGRAREAEVAAAAEYLDRIAAELRADELTVQTAVSRGDAKLALVGDVGLYGADLVTMATHGRTGAARVVLRSVAEHLLTRTPVPMLVLTPGSRRVTHLRTLLVPVDGTPGSAAALTTAQALASTMGSRIVLVEVVTPAAPFLATAELLPVWEAETRSRASAYVAGLARALVHTRRGRRGRGGHGASGADDRVHP